jgi:putative lipoic acid-binding regulatory protein
MAENKNSSLFEAMMEFPCSFPIKVMGLPNTQLEQFVRDTILQHIHNRDSLNISVRESSGGKYISVTAQFEAESREQLDQIYRILTANENIKMVL